MVEVEVVVAGSVDVLEVEVVLKEEVVVDEACVEVVVDAEEQWTKQPGS